MEYWEFENRTRTNFKKLAALEFDEILALFDDGNIRIMRQLSETDICKFFNLMGEYGHHINSLKIDPGYIDYNKETINITALLSNAFNQMLQSQTECKLQELVLFEEYSDSALRFLFLQTLTRLPRLNRLDITVKKLYELSAMLPAFTQLKTLEIICDMTKPMYTDTEIKSLCISLSDYTILPEVERIRDRIGYEVYAILNTYIKGNTSITSLTIDHVFIHNDKIHYCGAVSETGALSLMNMLRMNTHIKYINFRIWDSTGQIYHYSHKNKVRGSASWWINKYIIQNIKSSLPHKMA